MKQGAPLYLALSGKNLLQGRLSRSALYARAASSRCLEALRDVVSPASVHCGLCGWSGHRFRSFVSGYALRRDALCPRCNSLDRVRHLTALFMRIRQAAPHLTRMLDIGPSKAFSSFCRRDPELDYISVDAVKKRAMRQMNAEHLEFPDAQFDLIVCCHVLDYVNDDRRALSEIHRVLRPHGIAVLFESVGSHQDTIEWGAPQPRERDRVRHYGQDFLQRVRDAGLVWERIDETHTVFLASREEHRDLRVALAACRGP